jgi:ribosomal protein S18 acetylase RimI-like enzyme
MAPRTITTAEEFSEFIKRSENAVWMAWDGSTPAGFLRFNGYETDGATILEGIGGAFISGAYVRPGYRGRRAAQAMLDAALRDYALRDYKRCVLDFEAFNPEARSLWLKYFKPAALSRNARARSAPRRECLRLLRDPSDPQVQRPLDQPLFIRSAPGVT